MSAYYSEMRERNHRTQEELRRLMEPPGIPGGRGDKRLTDALIGLFDNKSPERATSDKIQGAEGPGGPQFDMPEIRDLGYQSGG